MCVCVSPSACGYPQLAGTIGEVRQLVLHIAGLLRTQCVIARCSRTECAYAAAAATATAVLVLLCTPPPFAATTVSAVLHAGSWVRAQTTAPACRTHRHRPPPPLPPPPPPPLTRSTSSPPPRHVVAVLLATLCLLVATVTLTLALLARCDVRAPTPPPRDAAAPSAADSIAATARLHTSSLVLSSLLATPSAHNLPRDISIIDTYSKRSRRDGDFSNTLLRRGGRRSATIFAGPAGDRARRRIVRAVQRLGTGGLRERYDGVVGDPDELLPTIRLINWQLVYSTTTSTATTPVAEDKPFPRLRGIPTKFPDNRVIDTRLEVSVNVNVNVNVNASTFRGRPASDSGSDTKGASTGKDTRVRLLSPTDQRPMPPEQVYTKDLLHESGGLLVLVAACLVLTLALGLVTCVLSHYRGGGGGGGGGILADPPDVAHTPTTAPMLSVVSAGATAGVGGMDRLRGRGAARDLTAAAREHQMRLHSVHTDIAINLPPSISLPDGEEHPFSSRLHLRDSEQESEIYQKCIRPPPNRTALESESPPPYRSSSAGLLGALGSGGGGGSSYGSSSDWSSSGGAPLVVRCHSMSVSSSSLKQRGADVTAAAAATAVGGSSPKTDFLQKTVKILTGGKKSQPAPAPTLPPVIVPTAARTRRTPPATADHHHHHQPTTTTGTTTAAAAAHLIHNHHHHQPHCPPSDAQPNNSNAHV